MDFLNKCPIVYWEIRFSKSWYHIETSQLIVKAKQLNGFYMIRIFSERFFKQTLVPSPIVNLPEVFWLCMRSCSITRFWERSDQKRLLLRITLMKYYIHLAHSWSACVSQDDLSVIDGLFETLSKDASTLTSGNGSHPKVHRLAASRDSYQDGSSSL